MILVLVVGIRRCQRETLVLALQREDDISIMGHGATIDGLEVLVPESDVVILDIGSGRPLDIDAVNHVRKTSPGPSILILADEPSDIDRAVLLEVGASGVLSTTCGVDEVLDAIRRLCRGELLYSAREMLDLLRLANEKRREVIAAQAAISALTPRELEVLQLLAWGKDVVEIAQELFISSETVRTHIHRALNKLGTRSRLRAVLFAVHYGAISLEPAP